VRRLLVAANVPASPILVALMMEGLNSSETSAVTRAARRNIPEDGILYIISSSMKKAVMTFDTSSLSDGQHMTAEESAVRSIGPQTRNDSFFKNLLTDTEQTLVVREAELTERQTEPYSSDL
jgi:hypothetical protein